MKSFLVIILLVLVALLIDLPLHVIVTEAAPCESESKEVPPWVEVVDVTEGCEAGKDFRHQCKACKCQDDGTKAECPKWIKCCTVGETWSTNSCNTCECSEDFERICYAIECTKSRFRRRRR